MKVAMTLANPDSTAVEAGLQRGDMIEEVNRPSQMLVNLTRRCRRLARKACGRSQVLFNAACGCGFKVPQVLSREIIAPYVARESTSTDRMAQHWQNRPD